MARKKNKFDKIEINQNYIPDGIEKESAENEQDEIFEDFSKMNEPAPQNKTASKRFSFKKAKKDEDDGDAAKISIPLPRIHANILVICVMVLSLLSSLVFESSFTSYFKGASLYVVYALSSVIIYLVPALVFCFVKKQKPKSVYLNSFNAGTLPIIITSFFLLLLVTALEKYYISYSFSYRPENVTFGNSVFEILLVSAILPAIFEEFLIHGVLLSEYSRFGGGLCGILICGFVFSLLHFDLQLFPVYLTAGIILGFVAYVTGSVFSAMILHFLNNFVSVFLADGMTFIASERIGGTFLMIVLSIFCFVLLIMLLQMLEKMCKNKAVMFAKSEDGEIPDKEIHFFKKGSPFGKAFFKILFSPLMIFCVIIFAVSVLS